MSKLKLKDISKAMRDIDICMMTTCAVRGSLESRPMSNNKNVDYDGDFYFFTCDDNAVVREIEADPHVNLSLQHRPVLLGKSLYISVKGKAALVRSRSHMEKHWTKDLALWFKDGLETPGLVMIHVKADRLKYWYNYEEGEIALGQVKKAA